MYKLKLIACELVLVGLGVLLVLSNWPYFVKVAVLLLATLVVPGFIDFSDTFVSYKKYLETRGERGGKAR